MLKDLIHKNRSYRRFYQDKLVELETLRELIDLARLSASGANRQPLKHVLSRDPKINAKIFSCLGWAGYLQDWKGPVEGERPAAYVIILGDTNVSREPGVDHGIAAQSIMLGATEQGLGGCMIASIDRIALRKALEISEQYKILLVLALGVPKEQVVIEEIGPDGSIRYYRDADAVHHLPKRQLGELIVGEYP